MSTVAASTPPLDEVMLAMDVVDTLRHNQDLVARELSEHDREQALIDKLRAIYREQGIDVPDHILKEGVSALGQTRFVYTPPAPGLGTALARLYVARKRWLPAVLTLLVVALLGLGGYFLAYQPYQQAQVQAAQYQLEVELPRRMQAVFDTIYEETKVQAATNQAEALLERGTAYAAEGNRAAAQQALDQLTQIRDTLRQVYNLRVVNREDTRSGFWRIPPNNNDATNYYIVVAAIGSDGAALNLPALNEENSQTETVSMWGLRVPESVYRAVETDKRDDGIIQGNIVGLKQYGFLDVDYAVPVLGGAVTRW